MEHTLEIRWFMPGAPPASVVDWITALGAGEESTRTDLYLVSNDPAMNVKLREGQIQTKHRLAEPALMDLGDRVQGIRERWVKWNFPTKTPTDALDNDPTDLWHPVHKERFKLTMNPDEQATLLEDEEAASPADAAIELTVVQLRGRKAWTICVEAEGEPHALSGTLTTMGRYFFAQGQPPALDADRSYGYAQWLAGLTHD